MVSKVEMQKFLGDSFRIYRESYHKILVHKKIWQFWFLNKCEILDF